MIGQFLIHFDSMSNTYLLEHGEPSFGTSQDHREYILRAAVLLVTGALTINPVSIFSGNIA